MHIENSLISISPQIIDALENKLPIVALESTVISHGLPFPQNFDLAHMMEKEVLSNGAIPATIGVVKGIPTIGLNNHELELFASEKSILKLSTRDIGYAVATKQSGATTVAATMSLAALAGINIFATGGIGGVHKNAKNTWDISADLLELSRTQVLVVCAGAKAILDLPATLEYLESFGVSVIGFQCNEFPAFYTAKSNLFIHSNANSLEQVSNIWKFHKIYGNKSGALLVVPPPVETALDPKIINTAIETALLEAEVNKISGQAVTPFLLSRVSELTEGNSQKTNISLLIQNAKVAAKVALNYNTIS